MRTTLFDHMNHSELGWVRFYVPNGTYDTSNLPNAFYHDLFEKNNVENKSIMNNNSCNKLTRAGASCSKKANTFTNGHWTCKKHASHCSIPSTNFVESNVKCSDTCEACHASISNIETACVTSCSHIFHQECLLKYVSSYPNYDECRFDCPTCKHLLCLYGRKLIESENTIPTYDEMLYDIHDESMDAFIEEYMKNNDTSFLIEDHQNDT